MRKVLLEVDDLTAAVLAMVLWSAEDARRRVRTNDQHPLAPAYRRLNELGEELGRSLGLDPEKGDEQEPLNG